MPSQTLKQNKTKRQIKPPNTTEFDLCWSSTAGHEACPEVWFVYWVRLCWRKVIFLCKQIPIEDGFKNRDENLHMYTSTLSTGALSDLDLNSPVHAANLCEFIGPSVLLHLEGLISLGSFILNLSNDGVWTNHINFMWELLQLQTSWISPWMLTSVPDDFSVY